MAIAAGVDKDPAYASGFSQYGANFAVPALFLASFPSWFVGVAFAAIAIGALVPAAIMHGLGLQIEAVRQIRGQSTAQVANAHDAIPVSRHHPCRRQGHTDEIGRAQSAAQARRSADDRPCR